MTDSQTSGESIAVSGGNNTRNSTQPEIDVTKLPAGRLLKRGDLPSKGKPWNEVELPVDVLLLTVIECELLSCVSYLNPGFFKSYHQKLGPVYFGKIGEGNTMKIALIQCQMGSSAPGGSLSSVKDAVGVLRPKGVICVGFCGGLNEKKLKLGDVAVSSKLATYAYVKVTESGTRHRGLEVPLERDFLSLVKSSADGWNPPLKDSEIPVNVVPGLFLTGPEVVDNKKRRAELTGQYYDALAIEMEAEGLYTAAHNLKMEWIVIKGVSDFADGTKSDTNTWRPFASTMAASLTAHILSDPTPFETWKNYKPPVAKSSKRKRPGADAQAPKRSKLGK